MKEVSRMSETEKLIIEIPKEEYELIVGDEACGLNPLTRAIAHGISLDDVKAEIEEKISHYDHFQNSNTAHGLEMALEIIDNIGKGE